MKSAISTPGQSGDRRLSQSSKNARWQLGGGWELSPQQAIFLFFAGALGGAINAVAGGGSFVAFPALLLTGVLAIPANATNTLALWVGTT